jgi:hypothetical protein
MSLLTEARMFLEVRGLLIYSRLSKHGNAYFRLSGGLIVSIHPVLVAVTVFKFDVSPTFQRTILPSTSVLVKRRQVYLHTVTAPKVGQTNDNR